MSMIPRGYESFNLLSPSQQNIYSTLLENLMGQAKGQGLDKLSAPYMRVFEEQIVPKLAERFSGLGAGAQSSSAFSQALGSSGADLAERLASVSYQQQQGALSGLQNLLGMQTQGLVQKSRPWWQELLLGLSGTAGNALGGGLVSGASSLLGNLFR